MRYTVAIKSYMARIHAEGLQCSRVEGVLYELYRQIGGLPLECIKTSQIQALLDGSRTSSATWRCKYFALRRFFEFWTDRRVMPALLMPPFQPPVRQAFIPYIYSRAQIRDLLRTTTWKRKTAWSKIDDLTFRTILLVLYGTGAMLGEVLDLRRQDVDLRKTMIAFGGNRLIQSRRIPVCSDLRDILAVYLPAKCPADQPSEYVFREIDGGPINIKNVEYKFKCFRRRLGFSRDGGGRAQPTMRDLRSSFAVHRIASWIKSRADLDRMLPALSAYLGQKGPEATERYLSITPERFRRELNSLSPLRGGKRWRDDPDLMKFLAAL